MVITKIERLRSRQARYRIRFDDRDAITLSEDLLVRFSLATGDEVPEERFAAFIDADEQTSARQAAYHYISYRPRSEVEVRRYLVRKGFSKERAEHTAADMIRLGLVDDASFAAMVIRDALRRGNTGPHGIRKKLAEKGIHKDLIQQLTNQYFGGELQKEIAFTLLKKRVARTQRSLKKLLPAQRKARLYQYLAQRGFDSDVVSYALKQIEV